VRNTINEADGYQPHIIAPEAGYRRLIEDGLTLLRDPCEWQLARGQVSDQPGGGVFLSLPQITLHMSHEQAALHPASSLTYVHVWDVCPPALCPPCSCQGC
jgi:hypothetical protein